MKTTIEAVRHHLGLTQVEMAERLGMTSRALQDIEAGKAKERQVHRLAVDQISLTRAVTMGDPMLATPHARDIAIRLAHLLVGTPKEAGTDIDRMAATFIGDGLDQLAGFYKVERCSGEDDASLRKRVQAEIKSRSGR